MKLLRALFLTSSLLLGACASQDQFIIGGYWWEKDPAITTYTGYRWLQVLPSQIPGYCFSSHHRVPSERTSCAIPGVDGHGLIISPYSEAEAMHIRLGVDGDTLYAHEIRHLRGWRHPS
jgi:hypothetical protein